MIYVGAKKGFLRSSDWGQTWQQIGNGLPSPNVSCLAVHPHQAGRLFLTIDNAIFQSLDYGAHWSPAGELIGEPAESIIWSLAISPNYADTVYVAANQGVYRSVDAGGQWQILQRDVPAGMKVGQILVTPQPERLILATSTGIWITDAAGHAWQQTTNLGATRIVQAAGQEFVLYANLGLDSVGRSDDGGQSWYTLPLEARERPIWAIAPDPSDVKRIYLGTDFGVLASSDGGATWDSRNNGLISTDVHQILDIPNTRGYLLAATRQGVYETRDSGQHWQFKSRGLSDLNIAALSVDERTPLHLWAGAWGGNIYRTTDGGETWFLASKRLAGYQLTGLTACYTNPRDTFPILFAATSGGVWRSLNSGESWEPLSADPDSFSVRAFWADTEHQRLYAGVGNEVYGLDNLGLLGSESSWQRLTSYPLVGLVNHIGPSLRQDGVIYVTTGAGGIYRFDKDVGEWPNLTAGGLPAQLDVTDLAIVSTRSQTSLIAVTSVGIFGSSDDGATWVLGAHACLDAQNAHTIVVDDGDPYAFLLGTKRSGIIQGRLSMQPTWIAYWPFWAAGVGLVITMALTMLWGNRRTRWWRDRVAQSKLMEDQWQVWDNTIQEALMRYRHVAADTLDTIPPQARAIAMRRYLDAHRDQDLILRQNPLAIEPTRRIELDILSNNWDALHDSYVSGSNAAPSASRLVEQLCQLLGFSPLKNQLYRSVIGYMVHAPTVRLSVPHQFPIMTLLSPNPTFEDVRDVRDVARILGATSFFALVIVPHARRLAQDSKRALLEVMRSGADDFIVLDYYDLVRLYVATDPARELVHLILAQIDLTTVSPYVIWGPVPANMFFGRDYEIKAIMRTIRDRSYALVGGRKIGKTSVLSKVQRLTEQTPGYTALHIDCQHVANFPSFFEALAVVSQTEIVDAEPDALRRIIVHIRQRYGGDRLVLLLDEVDNLVTYDATQKMLLFRVFRALSQEGLCRFVFCGERRLDRALHDPESPLFNFCNVMRLGYLMPQDVRRIVCEPMLNMGLVLQDCDALSEGVIELSSCHPNIVQFICQKLIMCANERHDRLIRMEDLQHVQQSDEFRDFLFEVTWGNATTLDKLVSVVMAPSASFDRQDVAQTLQGLGCRVSAEQLDISLHVLCLLSIFNREREEYTFAARSLQRIMLEANLQQMFQESLIVAYRQEQSSS